MKQKHENRCGCSGFRVFVKRCHFIDSIKYSSQLDTCSSFIC